MEPTKLKPLTQANLAQRVADATRLTRRQVTEVFAALNAVVVEQLEQVGHVKLPGNTVNLKRVIKPATEACERPHPFKPGELMQVKAKPETVAVKAVVLKALRKMVN